MAVRPAAAAPGGGGGEEGGGAGRGGPPGAGTPGATFNQPTDVAFDKAGNVYVADGVANTQPHREVREGRSLHQAVGCHGQGSRPVQRREGAGDRRAGQRIRGGSGEQAHSGVRRRGHVQVGVRQRGHAHGAVRHVWRDAVSLRLARRRPERHGRRHDLQGGTRRQGSGTFRLGRQAAQGVRGRQLDRLPQRERTARRRDVATGGSRRSPSSAESRHSGSFNTWTVAFAPSTSV